MYLLVFQLFWLFCCESCIKISNLLIRGFLLCFSFSPFLTISAESTSSLLKFTSFFTNRRLGFLNRIYLYIFRERGREGEKKGEKYQCMVASYVPPIGDLACSPGMCPDWESNWRPVGSLPVFSPLSYTSPGEKVSFIRDKFNKIHISQIAEMAID